jgi:putative CocE/NonD family hydrolase
MGAEQWRYADSLDAVTARTEPYYLDSTANATDVLRSGTLTPNKQPRGAPDHYLYDPLDISTAALESTVDPGNHADQRMVYARTGKELVYHTAAFDKPTEVSGFFHLTAWLAIDQPDTDFKAAIYEIAADGTSILLTDAVLRARYREDSHRPKLIDTQEPLKYEFDSFTFVSRRIRSGSRLRLVLDPINSIYSQRNRNSGRDVSSERTQDARPVNVRLYHDRAHPTALVVPLGQP